MGNDVISQSGQEGLSQKSNKLIIQKWWFWTALIVIVIAGVIYISKFGMTDSASTSPKNTSTPKILSKNSKEYKVGDVIVTDGGFTIKVYGVRESSGGASNKPTNGKIFYFIDIEIQNNDTISTQISSLLNFELRNTGGQKYALSNTAATEGSGLPDGTILPGKKLRGELAYKITKDTEGLELFIKPDLFTDTFVVKLDK